MIIILGDIYDEVVLAMITESMITVTLLAVLHRNTVVKVEVAFSPNF